MVACIRGGALLFWAVWMTIVWLTNTCEALKLTGWLPQGGRFASQNFELIREATAIYAAPGWLN
jgi:hypothetical protein